MFKNMKQIWLMYASIFISIGHSYVSKPWEYFRSVENNCEFEKHFGFLVKVSCPKDQPRIIVEISSIKGSKSYVKSVNCYGNNDEELHKLLPDNITGVDMEKLEIHHCSMPNIFSLRNIIKKLSKNEPRKFKFAKQDVKYLNASFWEGLTFDEVEINCKIQNLPEDFFAGFISMDKLNLSGNVLETLPKNLFVNQTQLKSVDLSKNKLRNLPPELFDKQSQLVTLDLSDNIFWYLPKSIFNNTRNLTILNLSYNDLQSITREHFFHLSKLKELYLGCNRYIDADAFINNKELTVLDLSRTHIQFSDSHMPYSSSQFDAFLNFIKVANPTSYFTDHLFEFVRTSGSASGSDTNSLKGLQDLPSTAKPILINLSGNQIFEITSITLMKLESAFEQNRQRYDISEWIINLNNNPFDCDCATSEFRDFLRRSSNSHSRLKNVHFLSGDLRCANSNRLAKESFSKCELRSENCPRGCVCSIRMIDRVISFNCSNAQLTQFPILPSVQNIVPEVLKTMDIALVSRSAKQFQSLITETLKYELYIENNQISALPDRNQGGYGRVHKIFGRNNSIKTISADNLPKNLSFLDLSHNKLTKLNLDVLRHLNMSDDFEMLLLGNNSLMCDCDSSNDILEFPRLHPKINYENLICDDGDLLSNKRSKCLAKSKKTSIIIAVSTLLFGLSIGTLIALYYKYKQEIYVWMFARNLCLWFITEEELDKDKTYDAFISYAHGDEAFVLGTLVPELEKEPHPFKICLHYRDWLGGGFIPDQIAQSVENSRRTVIVLSPKFLDSVWGRMEFRVAHQNALIEKRIRVIAILKENIGNIDELEPELKAYLRTNTYLEWGDSIFFERLRYALPHTTQHKYSAMYQRSPESVVVNNSE